MKKYNKFVEELSAIKSVKNAEDGQVYRIVSVDANTVVYMRNRARMPEYLSVKYLYHFYFSVFPENINNNIAQQYIPSQGSSVAVALLVAVYNRGIVRNNSVLQSLRYGWQQGKSEYPTGSDSWGCAIVFIVFCVIVCIYGTCGSGNGSVGLPKQNQACVINQEIIGIYNEADIPKIEEYKLNGDSFALLTLREYGMICNLNKGDKCRYVRYIKGGYYVVQFEDQFRPVIVPKKAVDRL